MTLIRPNLQFQILDIIHAGKDHRLKDRAYPSVKIISSEHGKKVNKHLIVRGTVHLVYDQHHRPFGHLAYPADTFKHLIHGDVSLLFH